MIFNILTVNMLGIVAKSLQIEAFEILSEGLNIMRKQEYFRKIFLIFFFFISLILSFGLVKTAQAASGDPTGPYDINDGIPKWYPGSVNQIQYLPIGNGLSMGYTLGLATNKYGQAIPTTGTNTSVSGPDGDVNKASEAAGTNNSYYSKMNVFLKSVSGMYISSTFQSNTTDTKMVSISSPDFMIIPGKTTTNATSASYSLLTNKLENKKFYYGHDSNGNLALKVIGNFVRGTSYDLQAEVVLRASPSKAPIVQRELYLKNVSSKAQSYGVLFGEDTKMGSDGVPIKDLGEGKGLFIQDGDYRLMISKNVTDGPSNYSGQQYNSNSMDWLKGFNSPNFSGTGAESENHVYGDILSELTSNNGDTSYSVKWPYDTINPGETKHYNTIIGVTEKPYAMPITDKTYTNETSSDGKNRVGDKLKFKLTVGNYGFNSNWSYKTLVDKIPNGLTINPNSIKMTNGAGISASIPASNYDSSSNTLTIPMADSLTDGLSNTVTFEATIDPIASATTLTNTGEFTGLDNAATSEGDKTYKSSIDIPVEKSPFIYEFTNMVKNETKGDADFAKQTDAVAGDIVDYQIKFTVPYTSTDKFSSGRLKASLPDGVTFKSAQIVGSDGTPSIIGSPDKDDPSSISFGIASIGIAGTTVTMDIQVQISKASAGTISTTALMNNVTTSSGITFDQLKSNEAQINISDVTGFTEIPQLIDFGSTNFAGKEKSLTNVSTTGQLIVNHPTTGNYYVQVGFTNTGDENQMINSENGDSLSPSADGLMFIKQRESSDTDPGTWTPIPSSPSSTPIQSSSFSGSQNLTNYIGVGDWKLYLGANTKPGNYSGTLTWSMTDGL